MIHEIFIIDHVLYLAYVLFKNYMHTYYMWYISIFLGIYVYENK